MGTYNKYSVEDIHVGDLIYFDDSPQQSNYDEYWEVQEVNALTGTVSIKLTYLFEDRYSEIHCSDIRQLLPATKLSQTG